MLFQTAFLLCSRNLGFWMSCHTLSTQNPQADSHEEAQASAGVLRLEHELQTLFAKLDQMVKAAELEEEATATAADAEDRCYPAQLRQ
eukprot:SAG31_NODE_8801_length_1385_cov_1.011664_2_plen_88_part_00